MMDRANRKFVRGHGIGWAAMLIAGVIAMLPAPVAQAAVLLSNIPASPITPDGATTISNGSGNPAKRRAIKFTVGSIPIKVEAFDYIVQDITDGPRPALRLDNAGSPGADIPMPGFTRTQSAWGSFLRYHYTEGAVPPIILSANTSYWFIGQGSASAFANYHWQGINSSASTGFASIVAGSQLDSGNGGLSWGAASDTRYGLLEMQGTLVPEPASLGVLAVGAVMMLRRRCR